MMLTAKQCEDFLFAVVNATDRSSIPHLRSYFVRLYRKWFPKIDPDCQHHLEIYYRDVLAWWRIKSVELPDEEPDAEFGFHVVIVRRKLRVIWSLASSGDMFHAEEFVEQMAVWLRRYLRGPYDEPNEHWRDRLTQVTNCLKDRLQRLMICPNPECMSPYFIRDKQRVYCSGSANC